MVGHDDDLIKRHEGHFGKIFTSLDSIKDNYVRFPTFVTTILTTALSMAVIFGVIFGFMWANINKNESDIIQTARQQVRNEEKIISIQREQDTVVTQLINALKNSVPKEGYAQSKVN